MTYECDCDPDSVDVDDGEMENESVMDVDALVDCEVVSSS
jgi:hypothetical protein